MGTILKGKPVGRPKGKVIEVLHMHTENRIMKPAKIVLKKMDKKE
jgi:hypothetical protein